MTAESAGRIRLAQVSDAEAIAALYRPAVTSTAISFEIVPPTPQEIAFRISETLALHPWLVCELDGQVAGYAYATAHRARAAYRWSVDTAVYVAASSRRRGIGRALYKSLFAILAAQGYVNAYAGITLPNAASVGLHESVGFEPVGVYRRVGFKLGSWHDVGWWQRMLKTHESPPDEPFDLAAAGARSDWNDLLGHGSQVTGDPDVVSGQCLHLGAARMLSVRRASSPDAAGIATVLEIVVAERIHSAVDRAWTADEERQYMEALSTREAIHVAHDSDGWIVGVQILDRWSPILPSMAHVGQVGTFVLPAWRGKGVGRRLWELTLPFARRAAYRKLVVQVRASNTRAQTFYGQLGFHTCGRLSRQVVIDGVEDDEVLMECSLA